MIIVSLTYKVPLDVVDSHRPAHMTWLDEAIAAGWLLAAGRKSPPTGGVLIAKGERSAIEALITGDPYHTHGVADYEVIEFLPGKVAPDVTVESLLG